MPTADEHLKEALEEFNDRVSELEGSGDVAGLLDAYVNRGTVLSLMGSTVAAIGDFDDAVALMEEMEARGEAVDPGCWVRARVSRGELRGDDAEAMAEDYAAAAERIGALGPGSRHFRDGDVAKVCAGCASDLVDAGRPREALPFARRALRDLAGRDDDASRGLYVRVCNLEGEACEGSESGAEESYREAARVGEELYARGALREPSELALSHASLEELLEARGAVEESVAEGERAIEILEAMLSEGSVGGDLLAAMHGKVARTLMGAGDVKGAERHLMRQVALSIGGAKDYMDGAGEGGWRYEGRSEGPCRLFIYERPLAVAMRTLFCPGCGSMIMPGLERCPRCGAPSDGGPAPSGRADAPPPRIIDPADASAPYMPYEPRPEQLQIISDIRSALDQGRHIVIESGTGTGKTIVSLAGALEHSVPRGKKIVYVTRTISQSDQVMKELKAVSALRPVSGITLTGRAKSCPLLQSRGDFADLSPSALSTLCADRKQRSLQGRPGGCPYFEKVAARTADVARFCKRGFPRSDELDAYCKNMGVCPYEAKKALLKEFDVVVAPYIHILDPDIRDNLLQNIGADAKGVTLVVDEAHNLIEAAREQESFAIDERLAGSARDEAGMVRSGGEVCEGVRVADLARAMVAALRELPNRHVEFGRKEALLPPGALEDFLCAALKIGRGMLGSAVEGAVEIGERMQESKADADSPASPLLEMSRLLERWIRAPDDRCVKAVRIGEKGASLTAGCIDPSDVSEFMRALPGAVHMSGTLRPLDQYAKVMGLPRNAMPRTYPSPFPKENLRVVYVNGVTTNYARMKADPGMMGRIEALTARLCNAVDRNVLVFFPSYRLMREARPYMEESVDKPLYWEEPGRQRATVGALDRFRAGRGGVFFCVMGGSVAEGMDFPGDELCFAVIVGIPYPPPSLETKAMSDMFDARYGKGTGWRYTSQIPAVRKMRQAIGRLIRTETDRGMAVILDERASRDARELGAVPTDDPVGEAARFFAPLRYPYIRGDGWRAPWRCSASSQTSDAGWRRPSSSRSPSAPWGTGSPTR